MERHARRVWQRDAGVDVDESLPPKDGEELVVEAAADAAVARARQLAHDIADGEDRQLLESDLATIL